MGSPPSLQSPMENRPCKIFFTSSASEGLLLRDQGWLNREGGNLRAMSLPGHLCVGGDRTVQCGGEAGLQHPPWTHAELSTERVHTELGMVLGTATAIRYEGCKRLPYTCVVLHEVQRFTSTVAMGHPVPKVGCPGFGSMPIQSQQKAPYTATCYSLCPSAGSQSVICLSVRPSIPIYGICNRGL